MVLKIAENFAKNSWEKVTRYGTKSTSKNGTVHMMRYVSCCEKLSIVSLAIKEGGLF